jgi:hypothetical protein
MAKKKPLARPTPPTKPMHGVKPKEPPFQLTKKSYDTLTVLVPGTFAPLGPLPIWYMDAPNGRSLYSYLQEVFVGQEIYVHHWNSWGATEAARHRQRVTAAKQLLRDLQGVRVGVLRILGHSHGANVASMATRDDLIPRRRGLQVRTLVLLSPAVDPFGEYAEYYPDMNNIGDLSADLEDRRFFTFHPVYDSVLDGQWAQDYRHTTLAGYETLHDAIAPGDHWSSTYRRIWELPGNRLADLIRLP